MSGQIDKFTSHGHPRKPALIDAAASVMNFLLPGRFDVRHGDYHVILRKI